MTCSAGWCNAKDNRGGLEASGRISGRRVGVLGLDDHTLEQVVEFVGCLGVKFVIVFLQGGQGTGWDWRLGMDTRSCTGAL